MLNFNFNQEKWTTVDSKSKGKNAAWHTHDFGYVSEIFFWTEQTCSCCLPLSLQMSPHTQTAKTYTPQRSSSLQRHQNHEPSETGVPFSHLSFFARRLIGIFFRSKILDHVLQGQEHECIYKMKLLSICRRKWEINVEDYLKVVSRVSLFNLIKSWLLREVDGEYVCHHHTGALHAMCMIDGDQWSWWWVSIKIDQYGINY